MKQLIKTGFKTAVRGTVLVGMFTRIILTIIVVGIMIAYSIAKVRVVNALND